MQSKASAVWQGGLKDGSGQVSTASGVLSNTPYNFSMRFEGAKGTTPEEMIAAAQGRKLDAAIAVLALFQRRLAQRFHGERVVVCVADG